MLYTEETADFTKLDHITNRDYVRSRKDFIAAADEKKTQSFLNYCFAIINQKNNEQLSVREASYAIAGCASYGLTLNPTIDGVISEAVRLRRHPSIYKDDHQVGWNKLVKQISDLRKKF